MSESASRRALLVDDHPDALDWLEVMLRRHGHSVTRCARVRDVVGAVVANRIDVVVLDLMFGGDMSGLDALGALKRHVRTRDVVVIVLSRLGDTAVRERAKALGADHFFRKPGDPEELLDYVEVAPSMDCGG